MKEKEHDKDLVKRAEKLTEKIAGDDYFVGDDWSTDLIQADIVRLGQEVFEEGLSQGRDESFEDHANNCEPTWQKLRRELEAERKLANGLGSALKTIEEVEGPDINVKELKRLATLALAAHRKARENLIKKPKEKI